MDQGQSEIALEEDEGAKTKQLKSICDSCNKPLIHGASGTISMWIFDGIYCSCKPEQRTAQILYFGTNGDSGDAEAAALADLIATSTGSISISDRDTEDKSPVFEVTGISEVERRIAMELPIDTPPAMKNMVEEPPKLRLVRSPDSPEVSVAAESVPLDAFPIFAPESSDNDVNFDFRPCLIPAQFSTETKNETITREILPAGQIALLEPECMIGRIIGDNYLVIEFIGKGLNGTVYKVNREGIAGVFALKILHPARFSTRQNTRFLAQAKSVKELDHHNVLALYDAGVTDDQCPFIVTDFFGSERLSDTLDADGPFNEKDAIDLFLKIADGLAHAHYMGITHRDVKPSNVRIKENFDGSKVVKLSDCGVGKMYPDPSRETRYFTESGMEYGDARYMSPEQYSGAKADHRADIYSFGCLMYEVLTGRPPFVANKVSMLIYKHIKKWPKSISERVPESSISPALENLIMRCLQKHPDNRYQTVSDLIDDLETIRSGKPVRRVFRTALSKSPANAIPRSVTELVIPDTVISAAEMMMARVSAAWLALWMGYSASARLSIKIVVFSAAVALMLFTCFKSFANHQIQYQSYQSKRQPAQHEADFGPNMTLRSESPAVSEVVESRLSPAPDSPSVRKRFSSSSEEPPYTFDWNQSNHSPRPGSDEPVIEPDVL